MENKILRKELYDLVWSTPLSKIQKDLGLSYSRLKSICQEYKIPLPENGFWSKIAFNKDVTILPFIDYLDVPNEIILAEEIQQNQKGETTALQLTNKLEIELKEKTVVPKLIKKWHPLVERFREQYEVYQKELKRGNWSNTLRGELSIQVIDSHLSRATRIFNTVINTLESKGHKVFIDYSGTNVLICEQTYQVSIRTKNKRVIDEDNKSRFQFTKLVPQDILIFKIARIESIEFGDTPNKPLEDKIDPIIARLELLALKDAKMKEEARIRNQIYQAERERREAIIRAEEQEKAKFEKLAQDAESWKKAMLIANYLDEMERKSSLTQDEQDYIAWGRNEVSRINPLKINEL
jgi:hypothetical protein